MSGERRAARQDAREYDRFYVPTGGIGRHEGSRIGTGWLAAHGADYPGSPLMIAPDLATFRSNSWLESATRAFMYESKRTWRHSVWPGGPALLLFPDDKTLLDVDAHPRVAALCVVEGRAGEPRAWLSARGPDDLVTGQAMPRGGHLDPVVREAIATVEASGGGSNRTTSDDAVETVRRLNLLRDHGYEIDPVELRAWALRSGWSPAAGRRLGELAEKVLAGHRFRSRRGKVPPLGPEWIEYWERNAAGGHDVSLGRVPGSAS